MVSRLGWKIKVSHSRVLIPVLYATSLVILVTYMSFIVQYFDGIAMKIVRLIAYVSVTEFYLLVPIQFLTSTYCVYARLAALKTNVG